MINFNQGNNQGRKAIFIIIIIEIFNNFKSNNSCVFLGVKGKSDSLRYEYDDHYFLTDPREFIFEFYPLQHDWQLLKRPITLQEFEQMPFVRSLFFRYGLYFPSSNNDNYNEICFDLPERSISCKAVLCTDTSGASTVRIGMPTKLIPSLIFHYNLKVSSIYYLKKQ